VSRIWHVYLREGTAGIKPKKSGRKPDSGRKLSVLQEHEIRNAIIDKTPDQLNLSGMLWTRQKIVDYIHREYGVTLRINSISLYLKRWGLTGKQLTKRAYLRDGVRVSTFMETEYPAITARANSEKVKIYWADVTGIRNTANYELGFALKGLDVETRKEHIGILSAITNRGSVRFMIYKRAMTQKKLIEFMSRLISDIPRKFFLILDNLKVYHGKMVTGWLKKNQDKIEVFFITPCSPESNPDE